MNPILSIKHINYSYHSKERETTALKDINFDVEPGSFTSIVGPSGCGKSTLLSIISGLIEPDSGTIDYNPNIHIGYMLQKDSLFQWRSVYKNVLLGLETCGQCTPEKIKLVDNMLKTYGLEHFKNSKPSQLSGGMRQRAALIRTLAMEPDILLLDEPFSALDYQTRLEVSDDIYRIIKDQSKTAILVTHDIAEAVAMGDKVIILSARPGTVKDTIDIHFDNPTRSPFATRSMPEFSDYFNRIWKEIV